MKVHGSNVQVGGGKGVMIEGNTFAGLNQDVTHNDAPTHDDWLAARDRRDGAAVGLAMAVRMGWDPSEALAEYDAAQAEMSRMLREMAVVLDARD